MNRDEAKRLIAQMSATWTTMPDDTALVWHDQLSKLDYESAFRAVDRLVRTEDRRPSIAKFHETYAAERPCSTAAKPQCGICDNGFVSTRCNAQSRRCDCGPEWDQADGRCPKDGTRTSARCPNGCLPRTADEQAAFWRDYDDRFRQGPTVPVLAAVRNWQDSTSVRETENPDG